MLGEDPPPAKEAYSCPEVPYQDRYSETPLHLTQQLVECIVIPKTCYHMQARPLQEIWCERLRRAINVAALA